MFDTDNALPNSEALLKVSKDTLQEANQVRTTGRMPAWHIWVALCVLPTEAREDDDEQEHHDPRRSCLTGYFLDQRFYAPKAYAINCPCHTVPDPKRKPGQV